MRIGPTGSGGVRLGPDGVISHTGPSHIFVEYEETFLVQVLELSIYLAQDSISLDAASQHCRETFRSTVVMRVPVNSSHGQLVTAQNRMTS